MILRVSGISAPAKKLARVARSGWDKYAQLMLTACQLCRRRQLQHPSHQFRATKTSGYDKPESPVTTNRNRRSRSTRMTGHDRPEYPLAASDIAQVQKAASSKAVYEQAEKCVYVHIDDVGVKEQKEHRDKKGAANEVPEDEKEATKDKRPMVQNTVARIEHNDKGFTLTGRNLTQVLLFVLVSARSITSCFRSTSRYVPMVSAPCKTQYFLPLFMA